MELKAALIAVLIALPTASIAKAAEAAVTAATTTTADSTSKQQLVEQLHELRLGVQRATPAGEEAAYAALAEALQSGLDDGQLEPREREELTREALSAAIKAAEIALHGGKIRYTRAVSTLAVRSKDKAALQSMFRKYLLAFEDEKGRYLALMDYADGLDRLDDAEAARFFDESTQVRSPWNSAEAHVRHARFLIKHGQPAQALELLNRFSKVERRHFLGIALLRQQLIHSLGGETAAVDEEIAELRRMLRNATGIGPIPKLSTRKTVPAINALRLPAAHAFAHANSADDSRGINALNWIPSVFDRGVFYAPWAVNAAEVIYNEARGETPTAQTAVAWAIRNRAYINMNGCDRYPGAEGHGGVAACRVGTPQGPQFNIPEFADGAQRWSCVVHGGTTAVGASQAQMNDGHVPFFDLDLAFFPFLIVLVANGQTADPSTSFLPPPGSISAANPNGAQEWRAFNYCALASDCKVRRGNVGGQAADPGNPCPANGGSVGDNFFWGRKP